MFFSDFFVSVFVLFRPFECANSNMIPWFKTVLGSHFGIGEFTHFRLPILVVGLGCSLGGRGVDPWPHVNWNPE